MLDLHYVEDVDADTDMNVVMTGEGGSSRCRAPPRVSRSTASLDALLDLAAAGCAELTRRPAAALAAVPSR